MNPAHKTTVLLAGDETLNFRKLEVPDNPTGAQILEAAHATGADALLLQRLPNGDLESIRISETPNLNISTEFILSIGDRSYSMFVDDAEMVWAARHVSGATLRKLARVPDSHDLLMLRSSDEPEVVTDGAVVDLSRPSTEKFVTRVKTWKLRVQGVTLEYNISRVKVGDAMQRAGFDPAKAWDIFLLIAGELKKNVDINFEVDLNNPGIERIRLMQRNVDNGEMPASNMRREFRLLAVDETHLTATRLKWETVTCDGRRWLVVHDYPLLPGYVPTTVKLALDIPMDYPQAQIDMFYFDPAVARGDGAVIPSTQVTAVIDGIQFQGWSRHRNGAHPWDPLTDNVATHLALVEHSLAREFGE